MKPCAAVLAFLLPSFAAWAQKDGSTPNPGLSRPDPSQPADSATADPVPQMEIDWLLVRFDPAKVAGHPDFRAGCGLHTDVFAELFAQGEGEVMDAVKLSALDGQEALSRAVDEVSHPTEFDVAEFDLGVGTPPNKDTPAVIIPGAFETRETGTIVRARPSVRADLSTVSLSLSVEICSRPDWLDYRNLPEPGAGRVAVAATALPVFRSQSLVTKLRLPFDHPTVAGLQRSQDDGQWLVHIITVRLHWIDPEPEAEPADKAPSTPP